MNVFEVAPAAGISPGVALLQGGVLAFYAFIGFEDMVNVAEEVRDARRILPWAILTALAVASVFYILIAMIAVSAVPYRELAASSAPLTAVVSKGFPGLPPHLFSGIAVFAVANTALLNFVIGSRLLYGMSSQGLLPGFLSKVHPRTLTPHRAILLVGAIGLVIAATGSFAVLAQSTSVILLSVFLLLNISLLALKASRRARAAEAGAFCVHWIVPALGAVSCSALFLFAKPGAYWTAGVVLAVAVVLTLIVRSGGAARAD